MQIEITGETERLIQAALATGEFASVEEFIATMARHVQPKSTVTELPDTPKHVDVDTLATQQGVGPIADYRNLKADFWPEACSVDDFVGQIRTLREQGVPRNF